MTRYRDALPQLGSSTFLTDGDTFERIVTGKLAPRQAFFRKKGIIIIHPNWWGQPPAILKGWVDRVIRPGTAYEFLDGDKGEGIPNGLLKAKSAVVFNTSNTKTERELAEFGDPLETIWRNCIFRLCGVEEFYRQTFNIVVTSSKEQRQEWLQEVNRVVEEYYP